MINTETVRFTPIDSNLTKPTSKPKMGVPEGKSAKTGKAVYTNKQIAAQLDAQDNAIDSCNLDKAAIASESNQIAKGKQ